MGSRARRSAVAVLLVVLAVALWVEMAAAGDATLTPAAIVEAGDPRSEGVGPGLVGSPLVIMGGVMLLGIVTAAVTLILARFARSR